jgi:exosome complex component RRP42
MYMILQDQYILNLASNGQRIDKRKADEYRNIEIEKNPIEKAEGSARVTLGKTVVIAGVKMGLGEPFSDRPDEGVLMVNAEFSPIASPDFETGPPGEDAIELARVVDRGIRESRSIDLKKLSLKKGEKVWMVNVDIHILNHAGNLIDAAALASIAALWEARFPELKGDEINYDRKTSKGLPMAAKPVSVTFVKMEGNFFMDPNLEEEEVMGARLTVTTKDNGNIVALQKGGSATLTREESEKAFELAEKKAREIRKLLG